MSGTAATAFPRTRVQSPIDLAVAELVRVVMAGGWTPEAAANRLCVQVHGDVRVLRLLRGRVARAMLKRPTRADARAAATLDIALARGDLAALPTRERTRR